VAVSIGPRRRFLHALSLIGDVVTATLDLEPKPEPAAPPPAPRRSLLRALGGQTAIYGLGGALRQALGLLLVPVYTRWLTPADYGALEILNNVSLLLVTLGTQGLGTAFFRFFAPAEEGERQALFSTCFWYLLASGALLCALPLVLAVPCARLLLDGSDGGAGHGPWIQLTAAHTFLQILGFLPLQLLRARQQAHRFIVATLLAFTVQLVLNVLFVVGLRLGVTGVLWGQTAGLLLSTLLTLFWLRGDFAAVLSGAWLRKCLPFGWPLVIVGVAWLVLDLADRFLLQRLASEHELGLYALGSKMAGVLRIALIVPFATAWGAFCFEVAKRPDAGDCYRRIATLLALALTAAGAMIAIWTPPVLRVIAGPDFQEARAVVPVLVAATVANGMFQLFDIGVVLANRTHWMAWIVALGGGLSVGLNFLLVPRLGMHGAAWSSLAAYVVIAATTYAVSQRLYWIPFDLGRLLRIAAVYGGVVLLAARVEVAGAAADAGLRILWTVLFFVLLWFGRCVEPGDLARARGLLTRRGTP
jgi:O-antigen/teichoic acid export membrane protein